MTLPYFTPTNAELEQVGFAVPDWVRLGYVPFGDQPSSIVYLGGPIRSVGINDAESWRSFVAGHLAEFGYTCFNPATAFHRPDKIDKIVAASMESINRQAIAMSSIVVALLDRRSMNLGTIRELEAGSAQGKRCIVVCGHEDISEKVSAHDLEIYDSIPFMLAAITGEDPGAIVPVWDWWREQDVKDQMEEELRLERDRYRQSHSEDPRGSGRDDYQDARKRDAEGHARPARSLPFVGTLVQQHSDGTMEVDLGDGGLPINFRRNRSKNPRKTT